MGYSAKRIIMTLVLGMGNVILLWHSLSLPYNYFTDEHNISALADFLRQIVDSSTRSESCIKSTLAAVSFYFEGLGKPSIATIQTLKG